PPLPAVGPLLADEPRPPPRAPVDADVDTLDGRFAGPRNAPHRRLAPGELRAVQRTRDERSHSLARDGFACSIALKPVLLGLVIAVEWPVHQLDRRQPFDGGDAVPAGYDQSHGVAVMVGQRLAVHRIRDDRMHRQCSFDRETALEVDRAIASGDAAMIGTAK